MIYQAVCSYIQYVHVRRWLSIWYMFALIASVIPSVWSYGNILKPHLFEYLGFLDNAALFVWWLIVTIIMASIDVLPERILVRR